MWISANAWYALVDSINNTEATVLRLETKMAALGKAIALLGKLPPDVQAKLNKIFDTATGDSAKIDAATSPDQKE
jgi:hypothetical protein